VNALNTVYVDNSATTQISREVWDEIRRTKNHYGNPSSSHLMGQNSKKLIEISRNRIAKVINAKPNEIIFTSCGTESNNTALNVKGHIITSTIEHSSVLNAVKNKDTTYIPVDRHGLIDINILKSSFKENTEIVSIMFANNEIGTIQNIKQISKICRAHGVKFHTDAVQAIGHKKIDVDEYGIDLMSISGHKLYAPKGIGVLYVRNGIDINPLLFGGGQEFSLRSGTENINGIIGIGKAFELLKYRNNIYIDSLKNKLIKGLYNTVPNISLNSTGDLPNIVNITFKGINNKLMLKALSANGIYASGGSACSAGGNKPSHVLLAIGLSEKDANSSVRFSFGLYNTEYDVNYMLHVIPPIVKWLRNQAVNG